ncbi:hypothetical protein D3875_07700 [Deinococcus cavernae]|uniref:Uncharacterized protein n=1 Tax=Deinococcus cavernae TaxID=2320857 RepID=A0A418V5U8_9DEIO|nr:hypothetical protein [Deinococcus cavernae]RJF71468.1 hypothetical protein D3875_07700 [Deinococcus cavernae]
MPVRIRIYGKEAIFTQGCWVCEDESLQAMLQALADPRAVTPEQEHQHALYAAGRYGGLIALPHGWEAAPLPAPEIRMEDLLPPKEKGGGLLGFLRRKK